MEKLVPKVWVLTPCSNQDGIYFKGDCPGLYSQGKLLADVAVEILPLAANTYHNGPFIDSLLWYSGPDVQYSPRSLFFNHFGLALMQKRDGPGSVLLHILFGATEKHPDTKTLAIIFPEKVTLGITDADEIIHLIQKSFVMHCQTRKGRQGEKLSQVESVYLILPQSTQEEVDKLSKAIESSATAL